MQPHILHMEDKKNIFDALAGEFYKVSSSLFPPTPDRDGARNTFTITEMIIAGKIQSKSLREERLVCPEAQFDESVVIRPETFRFRCCCASELHKIDLGYQLIPRKSLFKEEMGCDRLRKWSIPVFKPKTSEHAVIRLMTLSPITSSDLPPEHRQRRIMESRVVEMIRNDWGFPSTKVVKVTCDSGSTQNILTKPQQVEMKHFGVVTAHTQRPNSDDGLSPKVYPQSYICILLYGSTPGEGLEVRVAESTRIFHEDNPLGRLVVTMHDAMVAPLNTHSQEGSYNDVNFHFNLRQGMTIDAETFSSYLKASQVRLREIFTQGPVQDEKVIYSHCWQSSNQRKLPRSDIALYVFQKFVITDFVLVENSASKTDEGELVKTLEDANIWIHDYDSNGRSLFSQTTWHELTRRKTRLRSLGATFITSDNDRTAIEWLDEVDDLIKILRGSGNDAYDRVKIAVIDSEIHDSQKLQYQADIIREMYAETKFYIARIFKNDHADENEGPLLMAKAILWAIEPPRSIDIISISAGFPNYSKELDYAVTKAKSIGVLVIAAASNWQNVRSVAFPARHNLSTMCIYSTNTGNQGSRFNPEPRDDSPNLAILGEGFQHPDQRRNKPLTGTSSERQPTTNGLRCR
ncbi:hypothetical protein DER45DRAFT_585055 [Fusarium avenaceum]|nr:hypothetical protein DER45DRAFT_585055 [Fusarium avenaceum]